MAVEPVQSSQFMHGNLDLLRWRRGLTVRIVRVGGKAKADDAFVGLLRMDIELGQARQISHDNGKNPRGRRVERPQMPHGTLP
jgi:hypothetical protein